MLLVNNLDRSLSCQNNNFCIVEILILVVFGKNKFLWLILLKYILYVYIVLYFLK